MGCCISKHPETTKLVGPKRTIKMVLLGDEGVGKTTLRVKLCGGEHPGPTIGCDTGVLNRDATTKIRVWDFSGAGRFSETLRPYVRGALVYVFCYAVSDRKSLERIRAYWLSWLVENPLRTKHALLILMALKTDDDQAVLHNEGVETAAELGMIHLWSPTELVQEAVNFYLFCEMTGQQTFDSDHKTE